MITAQDLSGHWQRAWLKAPGVDDCATRVHWFQSVGAFIDIRIPADLPPTSGAGALADLPPAHLAALMECEGFAGHIRVAGGVCTWTRALNWHGTPAAPDVGRMEHAPGGGLMEYGVHADYCELWHRTGDVVPKTRRFEAGGAQAHLLWTAAMFMIAVGRPDRPATAALRTRAADGTAPECDLAAHFDSEYILGHWEGEHGVARLSTNPLSMGAPVVRKRDLEGTSLSLARTCFYGRPDPTVWRTV